MPPEDIISAWYNFYSVVSRLLEGRRSLPHHQNIEYRTKSDFLKITHILLLFRNFDLDVPPEDINSEQNAFACRIFSPFRHFLSLPRKKNKKKV